jgi:hypothetical protein
MHMRVFAFSSLAALSVAFICCGGDGGSGNPIPSLPTALPNVATDAGNPYQFNTTGVFIGTSGFANITVQNIGSQDMVVSSVTFTPDSPSDHAITLQPGVSPPLDAGSVSIAYNDYLVVALTCTPPGPDAGVYNGIVDIQSNASNLPDIKVNLQCTGVVPTP